MTEVWTAAIAVSIIFGGGIGVMFAPSVSGIVLGAFVALPGGAFAALLGVGIGCAFLHPTNFETTSMIVRISFGALLAATLAVVVMVSLIAIGGPASVDSLAVVAALGFVFGAVRPPFAGPRN